MIRPMQQNPREQHATPHKDAIALLPEFARLGLDRITLVNEGAQAHAALAILRQARAWGFDTESKPTFKVGEVSDGPHVLQLSTPERAWVFQLHDPECRAVAAELMALPGIAKAGFGLGDDRKRILHKLGVEPVGVLELNVVFRERGYRKDMGGQRSRGGFVWAALYQEQKGRHQQLGGAPAHRVPAGLRSQRRLRRHPGV